MVGYIHHAAISCLSCIALLAMVVKSRNKELLLQWIEQNTELLRLSLSIYDREWTLDMEYAFSMSGHNILEMCGCSATNAHQLAEDLGEKVIFELIFGLTGRFPPSDSNHIENLGGAAPGITVGKAVSQNFSQILDHLSFLMNFDYETIFQKIRLEYLMATEHLHRVEKPDTKPDTKKNKLPDSVDVRDLCHLLKKELPKGRSAIEIAREFMDNNEDKAQNLLRQARRYKHLWP